MGKYDILTGLLKFFVWSGIAPLAIGFLLCFPTFSFLPFYIGIGLAILSLSSFTICVILKIETSLLLYAKIACTYLILTKLILYVFLDVSRVETYECQWNFGGNTVGINLQIIGGFGWADVDSQKLINHLKKRQPDKVRVSLEITRDFGYISSRGQILSVEGIRVRELP